MKNKILFMLFVFVFIAYPRMNAQEGGMQPSSAPSRQPVLPQQSMVQPVSSKLTLDIKGMDIVDVLKMLSARSGMNIVVGKNVAGRVTLFLKDVPVEEAFEIILLSNDLAYDKRDGIVNVMTQRDYELVYGQRFQDQKQIAIIKPQFAKSADLARALNQMKSNLGKVVADENSNTLVLIDSPDILKKMEDFLAKADLPIETRIFELNYSVAEKLSPKLQEAITKGVGSVKIDERSNKVAVTDYVDKLDDIAKIIAAFDAKPMQVLIDAQVLEVKPSDQFQIGFNWDYWIKKNFDFKTTLPLSTQNVLAIGAATGTAGMSSIIAPGQYKGIIDALRTIGEVNVLSSPRIMALNNQEARIHIGTRDAYITSTTSQGGTGTTVTSQSVNFVDTGIQLRVTPTISNEGFVTMKIKPEVSTAETLPIKSQDLETDVPIVTTSESETTVMVKDGITIIIGGLAQDKRTKTVKKIPLLGEIPLLGYLFQSIDDKVEKDELVILLTPHIISGEKSYVDFAQLPPQEGAVARMENGEIVKDKFSVSKQKQLELEAANQKVNSYYRMLIDKINRQATVGSFTGKKGEVILRFRIASDGRLLGEPEVVSSTDLSLNAPAVRAVKGVGIFPPLPRELNKEEESFRIGLKYK